MIDIQDKKNKILKFLNENGPSLPIRISKVIEMDPVFVSAIASELISSNQVKTSHLKVGASSLYLIPGQEQQLENFSENLKKVEQEAYLKLKEMKTLIDDECEPAIRVALRNIKDFAIPQKINEKIIWNYAFKNEEEEPEEEKVEEIEEKEKLEEEEVFEEIKEIAKEQKENKIFEEEEPEIIPKAWETKTKPKEIIKIEKEEKEIENIFINNEEEKEEEPEFLKEVKKFLEKKKIEFIQEIRTEKKEIVGIVKIDSQLGPINMLLIAKNKKTISKDEIKASVQMSTRSEKPCLLIIRKEPSKTIENIVENNFLIKLEIME